MRIDIITVLPELLENFTQESIVGRAQKKGLVEIHIHNLRDYTKDKWRRVDDYPFGGFPGMVMQCEPIDLCISELTSQRHYDEVIFTSPDGEQFDQPMANSLSLCENIIILCGHYKGIDYRIREHLITKEVSIGDYVLTGGELAAQVVIDSVVRLLPGSLREASTVEESFENGLLEYPQYTQPAVYEGEAVPEVLRSGDHERIRKWRLQQSLLLTKKVRPDLFAAHDLTEEEKHLLEEAEG